MCKQPTISTVKSGKWSDGSTWNLGRKPQKGDVVFISNGHEITADTSIKVGKTEDGSPFGQLIAGAVCNAGTLKTGNGQFRNCSQPSTPAPSIDIQAMYLVNYVTGIIKAGNGGNSPANASLPCTSNKRCGEGQNTTAGSGGDITATVTTIINEGLVRAGNGGNAGAAHASAIAGSGGSVDFTSWEPSTSSSMPLESGDGGDICAPKQWWRDKYNRQSDIGKPGSIVALIGELKGNWNGTSGKAGINIYYDPILLKPSADFSMVDFNKIEIYTDEGGEIDFTQLKPGAIAGKHIRILTKALNGKGGILNLTGINSKLFVATEKVEIYADSIKTDPGITIRDLIDAPEVVVEAGKIPYFASISSNSLVTGQPNSTVEVPIRIHNIASKIDTYTFELTDSQGWALETLPDVTVQGYEVKYVKLKVTLPAERGVYNTIKVTAISQTTPSTQETVEIGVEVDAGADSDGDTYPDSLDAFPSDSTEWLDTDKDGLGDNIDTDDDNDGMLDVWEAQYDFLSSAWEDDAKVDSDDDGFTNLEESEASTDPSDPNSKPIKTVDVWVSDPPPDDGSEPGKASYIWRSPDVWVRNEADNGKRYQNVKHGQDNYVYVNVRNRGTLTAENTKVEVYRSKASMGQAWPRGWGLVGKGEIASLAPDTSDVVQIKWNKDNIPKPGHYCFYVRVLNDDDPMFAAETNNMVQNTRTNNNIAWRNFNVVGFLTKVTDKFEVEIGNPRDTDTVVEVIFDEKEQLLANDGARAIVDLGATLFQRWQAAGGKGENIKVLSGTEVELLATPAKFMGISLKVGEPLPITMRVDATKPMPGAGVSRTYNFSAQEFIGEELIGGVDYAITTRAQDTDSDGG